MNVDIQNIKYIYTKLADEESKEIFKNRLMYSMTGDYRCLFNNLKFAYKGEFLRQINKHAKNNQLVIFSSGIWGKNICHMMNGYPWKCFIDNNPQTDECLGLPVYKANEWLDKEYDNEHIVICSSWHSDEIYEQLIHAGIPKINILNVGKMIYKLRYQQYFDLQYLEHAKGTEVFVDIGSFDGMSSVKFSEWSGNDNFVYAFEPDGANIEKCKKTLDDYRIRHKIICKGTWSKDGNLQFENLGSSSSHVNENSGGGYFDTRYHCR